jgi:hypothetical protein
MNMKRFSVAVMLFFILLPYSLFAHHGGVSLALGPGSPIETNSPLTLPQGGFVISGRVEHADFRRYSFAEPLNKDAFTFYSIGLSYGLTPYLTTSVFHTYNIKRQDTLGDNRGFGDIKLLGTLGCNYYPGRGFRLNVADDTAVSLETSPKTFIAFFGGFSLPTGKSKEELGGEVDRGMQPGFRSPTYTIGLSAAREILGPFSLFADTSYEVFTKKDSFKFGNEWRLNLAGVYELYGKPERFFSKIDGVLELNLLNIARDEELGDGLRVSGGTILYLSPGLRFSFPKLWNANIGLLLKIPVSARLNERDEQQGSEGLEKYRFIATLSFFF